MQPARNNLARVRAQLAKLGRWGWGDVLSLAVSLALLAIAYGFIQLTDEVLEGDTQTFDEWVLRSLRRADDPAIPIGPAWLRVAGFDASALGSTLVLTLVVVAVVGLMLLERRFHVMWLTIFATLGGVLLSFLLKHFIGRDRPSVVPHLQEVTTPSFPSGHAMLSAVVYLTLGILLMQTVEGRLTKMYCLLAAAALTLIVGLSRIYLGVHYPSDVLAGWMAGVAWALGCAVVAHRLKQHHLLESPG